MKKRNDDFTLYCGGCYRKFTSPVANELLRSHIEDDPCEHYLSREVYFPHEIQNEERDENVFTVREVHPRGLKINLIYGPIED